MPETERIPGRVRIAITTPDGVVLDDSVSVSLDYEAVREDIDHIGQMVIAALQRVDRRRAEQLREDITTLSVAALTPAPRSEDRETTTVEAAAQFERDRGELDRGFSYTDPRGVWRDRPEPGDL
jgi:hypothetical protein